jgi:release factor glutamine methyltransferase
VASNPPYVSEAEWESLPPDVKKYEPRTALVAGPLGTEVIARLIPQAAERLRPGGHLLMEISPMIHEAVGKLIEAEPRWELQPTVKDLARHARVVVARRAS